MNYETPTKREFQIDLIHSWTKNKWFPMTRQEALKLYQDIVYPQRPTRYQQYLEILRSRHLTYRRHRASV